MHCLPSLLRKPNNAIRYREHRSWASEFKLTLEVEAQVGFQGLDKETQTSTALSPDHQELHLLFASSFLLSLLPSSCIPADRV